MTTSIIRDFFDQLVPNDLKLSKTIQLSQNIPNPSQRIPNIGPRTQGLNEGASKSCVESKLCFKYSILRICTIIKGLESNLFSFVCTPFKKKALNRFFLFLVRKISAKNICFKIRLTTRFKIIIWCHKPLA